jgi:hypothetical protein
MKGKVRGNIAIFQKADNFARDRFYKTPFRAKTFRTNFHPQSSNKFHPKTTNVNLAEYVCFMNMQ